MAGKSTANDVSEIEAYFERQAERTAKGWKPEAGTTVRGKVIGLRLGQSDYPTAENPTGEYPIVIYRVLDMFKRDGSKVPFTDTIALHIFHKVLRDRMKELGTEIDTEQFVTYIGPVEHNTAKDPKTGEPAVYHMYDAENVGDVQLTGKQEGFTFGS
jgi:hypothetical protein